MKRAFSTCRCLCRQGQRVSSGHGRSPEAMEGGFSGKSVSRVPWASDRKNRGQSYPSLGRPGHSRNLDSRESHPLSTDAIMDLTEKQLTYLEKSTRRFQSITSELDIPNPRQLIKDFITKTLHRSPNPELGIPSLKNLKSAHQSAGLVSLRDEIMSKFALYTSVHILSPEDLEAQKALADMTTPAEWFPQARATPRRLHLHVGPTNSGKTYQALKRLQDAKTGCFAGPLRLLAFEIYDRFNKAGVPCNLSTGEESRREEGATITASTIEMLRPHEEMEVLVIDEIQMIADPERGSAWTQAVIGACAKEIHMCGEASVVDLIRKIAESLGDTLEIHNYSRLGALEPMTQSLGGTFQSIESGDAIVTFSRTNIFDIKRTVEQATGKKCAVVYGGLPPESRAAQARLFNDPDSGFDVLVASDAIGMGLNLSIKRVVFETLKKWNGREVIELEVPQIKQIAGRAGRFKAKTKPVDVNESDPPKEIPGYVTTLRDEDLSLLHEALGTPTVQLQKAVLSPSADKVERFSRPYPSKIKLSMVLQQLQSFAHTSELYTVTNLTRRNQFLDLLHPIKGLSFDERWTVCDAPLKARDPQCVSAFLEMTRILGAGKRAEVLDLKEVKIDLLDEELPETQEQLGRLESLHSQLTLYLWLAIRFPGVFVSMIEVYQLRKACEEVIEHALELMKARQRKGVGQQQFVTRGMMMDNRRKQTESVRNVHKVQRHRYQDDEDEDENEGRRQGRHQRRYNQARR